ncbi:MAG: 50S ribosomal protein L5 [Crocinitomicaceae bacterium]|nr:50S ribosomal protein L5 [Crocinitomicaceae bacterium]
MSYKPRLKERYSTEIAKALKEKYGFKSTMRVPKLEKIVLSQGLGEAVADKKVIDAAMKDLALIAGQQPISTMSKKDISNFKLRKGMPIGTKVTLRGDKMYEFLDRLINIALPRTRDFRGISPKGFDGNGNFNMGIKEHIIFPEIDIDKVNKILGMDITFVTSTDSDEEAKALLEAFYFPFVKDDRAAAREAAEAKKVAMKKEREDAQAALREESREEGSEAKPEGQAAPATEEPKADNSAEETNNETEATE